MRDDILEKAKTLSRSVAASYGTPRFYREKSGEVERSLEHFRSHPVVRSAISIASSALGSYGHGFSHARKVAVDAGAIVLVESGFPETAEKEERMLFLAHLAGLFHDIRRSCPNHAQAGAEAAEGILQAFDLTERERRGITGAIRNHEAFQAHETMEDPAMQLLSDALYDADKFRWGPDNFTEMIWDIIEPLDIPLDSMLAHFLPGLKGIEKIRGTFRTSTGREYGPDFIDRGLDIGRVLYEELKSADFHGH